MVSSSSWSSTTGKKRGEKRVIGEARNQSETENEEGGGGGQGIREERQTKSH